MTIYDPNAVVSDDIDEDPQNVTKENKPLNFEDVSKTSRVSLRKQGSPCSTVSASSSLRSDKYSDVSFNIVSIDDSRMPISFSKTRHTDAYEGINCVAQSWRMKERVNDFK